MKYYRFPILAIVLFLLCIFWSTPVHAIQTTDAGAYPSSPNPSNPMTKSWFIYSLPPGKSKQDSVTIVNNTNKPITYSIYPVDAGVTKDGTFYLYQKSQQQTGIGIWVQMSLSEITVPPVSHKNIPFTITIPKHVTIGDHAGGIIFEAVSEQKATTGLTINIVSRLGVRIYETVPGKEIKKLNIQNFSDMTKNNTVYYSFQLQDAGNIYLSPVGTITTTSIFNHKQLITLANLGTIGIQKPNTYAINTKTSIPFFDIDAVTLHIISPQGATSTKTMSFLIYNTYTVITVCIFLILLLYGIIYSCYRKYKKNIQKV